MRCLQCGICCEETEMLLSNNDIERLRRKGYDPNFFAWINKEGYALLRNISGVCVFFDAKKRRCKERAVRPLGCRIYPVMQDEEFGIVVDEGCPSHTMSENQKAKRGREVLKLLKKIDAEAKKRRFE